MSNLHCLPNDQVLAIEPYNTVLTTLLAADIPHAHACGGNAACSTCRIMVLDGAEHCSSMTRAEKALAEKLDFPVHIRLACQMKVRGDVTIQRLVLDSNDVDLASQQLQAGSMGTKKTAAFLYGAVRGLTDFDETNFPYDIIYSLGRYYHHINAIIRQEHGQLASHTGFRFLALFSDPKDAIAQAIRAGLAMQAAVTELNERLSQLTYENLSMSCGIHYGSAVVIYPDPGNSAMLTAIGEAVTETARVESANRVLKSQLLISDVAYRKLGSNVSVARSQTFKSAQQTPLTVHEVTAIASATMTPSEVVAVPSNSRWSWLQTLVQQLQRF